MAKKAKRELTVERDAEHMTREEQVELLEAQMFLRAHTIQITSTSMKLRALTMRPNALLKPERISAALDEMDALVTRGRQELKRIAIL